MSISISNLCKKYGQQQVLNNVSFDINEGEIVGFIGPNGAGKSTTMKCITGYIPYNSGSVKVCGIEVAEHPTETKKLIGYLPEHNPLYLEMYVKEYLTFAGRAYGLNAKDTKKRVDELIETVGLTKEYRKKIGQLSKGYRQRVGIAQALIHDPKVLILDEPTTGLDPNQLVEVRNLISEIGKSKAVMLSTHIMQEVNAICDRVIVINQGHIVADESEAQIITSNTDNKHLINVEFTDEIDATFLNNINGVISTQKIANNTYEINAAADIRAEIFKAAVENSAVIISLMQKTRNMEDVFHELTNNSTKA